MSDHFATQLREHSHWFAALSASQQQQLLAHARLVQLGAGQRLFSRGDEFDGIYVAAFAFAKCFSQSLSYGCLNAACQ